MAIQQAFDAACGTSTPITQSSATTDSPRGVLRWISRGFRKHRKFRFHQVLRKLLQTMANANKLCSDQ